MSSDSHFLRSARMDSGVLYTSSPGKRAPRSVRPRQTTLIIKDSDVDFLTMLTDEQNKPTAATTTKLSNWKDQVEVEEEEGKVVNRKECPVCLQCSPVLTNENINAVTSCEHVYCYECALRLLYIANKTTCPICRQELTKVILTREIFDTPEEVRRFVATTAEQKSGLTCFFNMVYYQTKENKSIYPHLDRLLWYQCSSCNVDFSKLMGKCEKTDTSFSYISKHLKTHDTYLCDLCFFNLELFPLEFDTYSTERNLLRHKRDGDMVGDSFIKHPQCTLCLQPTFFFANEQLAEHCAQTHISCYVCKSQSIFFLHQNSLNEHVTECHIVCPICEQAPSCQVIGFATVADLKSHALLEHVGEKIDYEAITRATIARASTIAGGLCPSTETNEVITQLGSLTLQETHDQIDNLLRHRHKDAVLARPPSFSPTNTENYLTLFPSINSLLNSSTFSSSQTATATNSDASLSAVCSKKANFSKPISNVISANANFSGYENEFPGLGGGGTAGGLAGDWAKSSSAASNWNKNSNTGGSFLPSNKPKVDNKNSKAKVGKSSGAVPVNSCWSTTAPQQQLLGNVKNMPTNVKTNKIGKDLNLTNNEDFPSLSGAGNGSISNQISGLSFRAAASTTTTTAKSTFNRKQKL